jgi:photosystem II stability/assembly factor-like uncharacterized protein
MSGEWISHATWKGGTVGCLTEGTTDGGRPLHLAGTATGIIASSDGGRSWSSLSPEGPVTMVETIACSSRAAAERAVYAGGATGLYRSDDAGATWCRLAGGHAHAVVAFVNRDGAECVVVGTDLDGVIRSEDGGWTWDSANPGLLESTVLTLAELPAVGGTRAILAGTTSGIYVSRNDGKAWRPAEIPGDECAVICLAVSPDWATDGLSLAGTEEIGLLRSRDRGLRWEPVPHVGLREISTVAFAGDAQGRSIAAAGGRQVVFSEDGGEIWRGIGETPGDIAALRFVGGSDRSNLVVAQYDEGIRLFERG